MEQPCICRIDHYICKNVKQNSNEFQTKTGKHNAFVAVAVACMLTLSGLTQCSRCTGVEGHSLVVEIITKNKFFKEKSSFLPTVL